MERGRQLRVAEPSELRRLLIFSDARQSGPARRRERLAGGCGKRGEGDPGPRGPRGNRDAAETPVTIVGWALDVEDYRACPALSNGEVGAILDLRPLFEQFHDETGTA